MSQRKRSRIRASYAQQKRKWARSRKSPSTESFQYHLPTIIAIPYVLAMLYLPIFFKDRKMDASPIYPATIAVVILGAVGLIVWADYLMRRGIRERVAEWARKNNFHRSERMMHHEY